MDDAPWRSVTVETLPQSRNLVAVWQAAPSPANDTKMRLGVEGLDMQHILISLSKDPEGRRWVAPQVVPLRNKGALWSPAGSVPVHPHTRAHTHAHTQHVCSLDLRVRSSLTEMCIRGFYIGG